METLKFILFTEALALFVIIAIHIVMTIIGDSVPLIIYPVMLGIVLFVDLFTIYIVVPFAEWLFDD